MDGQNIKSKNHKARNLILGIVITPMILLVLSILIIVAIVSINSKNNDTKSDQAYTETNNSLAKLEFSKDYKKLAKNISKGAYADNFGGGYSTNWKVAYKNLSSKTPIDVTKDLEKAFKKLGCVIDGPNKYESRVGLMPNQQRSIEISVRPGNQKAIEESADEVSPKPVYCRDFISVNYFFDKKIDTQTSYSVDLSVEDDSNASDSVEGVSYDLIDFSKQRVDKFIISGTVDYF